MLDLGKHASAVLFAYGISLGIIIWFVWITFRQAAMSKRHLKDVEQKDG